MSFRHNSVGIEGKPEYEPLPDGMYTVVISDATEKKSKKGNDMIECELTVIENPDYHGKTLKHYVVFLPAGEKGDWMSVHFRKCIGIPYGGEDDEMDARDWKDKKLRVKLGIEEREYNGKIYKGNKVTSVFPYGDNFPEVKEPEIPF